MSSIFLVVLIISLLKGIQAVSYDILLQNDPSFQIVNPTSLASSIQYHPATFGSNFIGNPGVTGKLLAGPSSDPYLCGSSVPATTPNGINYAGNIMLIPRGRCTFVTKALNAQSVNVSALVMFNCPTGPPNFCPPGRFPFWALPTQPTVRIPTVITAYEDLNLVWKTLSNFSNNINATAYFPGTMGLTNQDDMIGLKALAMSVRVDEGIIPSGVKNLSALLVPNPPDPCLNRIIGVFCTNGRVTLLDFSERSVVGTIPTDIAKLSALEILLFDTNSLTGEVPDMSTLTQLRTLALSTNQLTNVPIGISKMSNLTVLLVGENKINTLPTELALVQELRYLDISRNTISNFPQQLSNKLVYFDTSNNNIVAPLPNFSSFTQLQYLSLAFNQFSGNNIVSYFENMPSLKRIDLRSNKLSGNVPSFSQSLSLVYMDLSLNEFTGTTPASWNFPLLESALLHHNKLQGPFDFSSTALLHLDVSYNLFNTTVYDLTDFGDVLLSFLPYTIQDVNYDHNLIEGEWSSISLAQRFLPNLKRVSVAHNFLTSVPYDTFDSGTYIIYLDLSYNKIANSFPNFVPQSFFQYIGLAGNPLLKNPIAQNGLPFWIVPSETYVKASLTDSYVCPTFSGKYSSISVGLDPQFYKYALCKCDRGYYGSAPSCQSIPSFSVLDPKSLKFTDNAYGDQRLTQGIDTSWVVGGVNAGHVLGVKISFTLDLNVFKDFEDIIEVYEGDQSLAGVRVESFRGSNPNTNTKELLVLAPMATVVFRSKALLGKHFEANYTLAYTCPNGYEEDIKTSKCYQVFIETPGVQIAVYICTAIILVVLIGVIGVVAAHRNTMVLRSSSVPFLFCMLFFQVLLSVSSIFYAISPKAGDWVCHIRPWTTAIAIVGTLGALIVKVDRIRKIFGQTSIQMTVITNADLGKLLGLILLAEFGLLIWYSVDKLTYAERIVGSKYTAGQLLYQCSSFSNGTRFSAWLGLQFAYIGVFILVGSLLAWQIRKVPTAFNESPQIASAFMAVTLFIAILVPLNFIVDDNPNALILIRGVGANASVLLITMFLFGSKLYYILDGRADDKSLSNFGSTMDTKISSSNGNSSSNISSGAASSYVEMEYRKGNPNAIDPNNVKLDMVPT